MVSVNDKATTMIKLGDKVYLITGKVVQDMGQLVEMMAIMGKRNKTSRAESAPIKYEDTGVSETIAGLKGNIYRYVERGAKHEVVLGHDEDRKRVGGGKSGEVRV